MSFWGQWVSEWLEGLGRLTFLVKDTIASLLAFKVAWRDLLFQIYFVGVKSQSVVLITGAFTGMVLSAQTYLVRFYGSLGFQTTSEPFDDYGLMHVEMVQR